MNKVIYKNYKDIEKSLNEEKEIYDLENYHWWLGCLDGCQLCGRIDVDEKYQLLKKLEEKFINV